MFLFQIFSIASALKLNSLPRNLEPWTQLTRPHNIPASMIFSIGGALTADTPITDPYPLLETAAVVATVTTASVVVNNYYDAELKNDGDKNPIVTGSVSFAEAKTLFSQLYLLAAVSTFTVFRTYESRCVLLFSIITTYIYSKHLKPHVFIKNIAVASVTALAPYLGFITSSSNAVFSAESATAGLCAATFFGIFSREILMDITDIESDAKSGTVTTIPVAYGVNTALAISGVSAFLVCCVCYHYSNNVIMGEIGSIAMLYRVCEAYVKGESRCEYAIKESVLTFVFVVASFLNV